jgi:hypothetical protein
MRIYEGSPRQDFEEVLRSIGAVLDARAAREVLLVELQEGFLVQALATEAILGDQRSEQLGRETKITLTFLEDDLARFVEEGHSRRGTGATAPDWQRAGYYEQAFRVIGRFLDERRPRDIFFFEQSGAFVVRILAGGPSGGAHELIEFTREDIADLIARGPALRAPVGGEGGTGPA